MMTFLPFACFAKSAACLDMRRLQNQRTEARFVLEWLEKSGAYFDLSDYGAARMWVGFRDALAMYYNAMLQEYEHRGKVNGPTLTRATVAVHVEMPPWLGDERFHSSHRAVLLQKDAKYYGQHGWAEADRAEFHEYLYPHRMEGGQWGLYPQSKYKKRTIVAIAHGDRIDVQADQAAAAKAARANTSKSTKAVEVAVTDGQAACEADDDEEEESQPLSLRRKRKAREPEAIAEHHLCETLTTAAALALSPAVEVASEAARPDAAAAARTLDASHAELAAEYTRLTKTVLPKLAAEGRFPIRFDHCFQRVALDHAFGACWYGHLDRSKGAAIKQIGTQELARAVAVARHMVAEGIEAVRKLDEQSLLWRGKQPKLRKVGP